MAAPGEKFHMKPRLPCSIYFHLELLLRLTSPGKKLFARKVPRVFFHCRRSIPRIADEETLFRSKTPSTRVIFLLTFLPFFLFFKEKLKFLGKLNFDRFDMFCCWEVICQVVYCLGSLVNWLWLVSFVCPWEFESWDFRTLDFLRFWILGLGILRKTALIISVIVTKNLLTNHYKYITR